MARATRATRAMTAANRSGLSDCGPSDSASSGLGCTSMISPSAPAATAAMAIASTYSQWPVPWLGSTTTGRCVSFLSTGTALRSSVKRVAVSNVRMPRSHRMTLGLPPLSTYSADSSHSWIEVDMPRLSSTGLPAAPTLRSSEKFCTLRAPIWRMSACSATTSTLSGSMTSVMIGSPVSRRASARSFRPSSSRPWNAYGEVRGLKAPPRRTVAPAAFTRAATCRICSRDSTEHGPAIHDLGTADGDVADAHDAVGAAHLAARELEGLQDRRDRLHALQRLQRPQALLAAVVADGADDRAQLPADGVRPVPHGRDAALDVADLAIRRPRFQHDDHDVLSLHSDRSTQKGRGLVARGLGVVIAAGVRSARGSLIAQVRAGGRTSGK